MNDFRSVVERLYGPILVLGASGFVGSNLLRMLLAEGADAYGTTSRFPAWRLEGLPEERILACDLLVDSARRKLLEVVAPLTVFDCVAYGAYSFERDVDLIYRTNLNLTALLMEELHGRGIRAYVHAGSSSEYGLAAAGPSEETTLRPNSHYAASKAATSGLIYYMGTHRSFPCVNLRLFSVYGPYEDASRLIPELLIRGESGELPVMVGPQTTRDFVYVDDVCRAFLSAALTLAPENFGASFNIGTGKPTTIAEVAQHSQELFDIEAEPEFSMPARDWDLNDWYAEVSRAQEVLGWTSGVTFREGLERTRNWFQSLDDLEVYQRASKAHGLNTQHSVSAIVACYLDGQAIPYMHERLTKVFKKLRVDYEIIFVNDGSPDDSEEVIRGLSGRDHRVIGITHSRNFGSQAAFRSGLEIATKNACVLLDGDLQDPPELIEQFVEEWRKGADVVYGRRVNREAPWHMGIAYKAFYWVFAFFSYVKIPRDAGDFSLIEKRVVRSILQFPERDFFLRGVRAFVGFRQVGVDYVRPERKFGRSTNNLLKNVNWAKKGILSFSNVPLNALSFFGVTSLGIFAGLGLLQIAAKLFYPDLAPRGLTTLILVVLLFGSLNLFAVGIVGEYVGRIFEEVKRRPRFVRRSIIRDGEVRDAGEEPAEQIGPAGRSGRSVSEGTQ